MKKLIPILLLFAFASCTKTVIQSSLDTVQISSQVVPNNLYYHQFTGTTQPGSIGTPRVGNPYTLLGGGIILGTQPTCRVMNGRWVTPDCKDIYAIQEFAEGTKA